MGSQAAIQTRFVSGSDLKVGDVVSVWWSFGRDTIIGFREHSTIVFEDYRRSAKFASGTGMTVPDNDRFEVVTWNGAA